MSIEAWENCFSKLTLLYLSNLIELGSTITDLFLFELLKLQDLKITHSCLKTSSKEILFSGFVLSKLWIKFLQPSDKFAFMV